MKQIEINQENPMETLFGVDLGTRGRDGRTYRVFFKESEKSKSGKAVKGELIIVLAPDERYEQYTYICGVTYLPNFVIENQALDWIIENKLANRNWGRSDMFIENGTYGITWGERRGNRNFNAESPEVRAQEHATIMADLIARYGEPES